MEFPKLHEQTEKKLASIGEEEVKLAEDLEKAEERLEEIETTVSNKERAYKKYQQLYSGDPEEAKAYWKKKKLGISCERWQKKWERIEELRSRLKDSRKIEKEEELLEKLSATIRNKQPAYERYQKLYTGDPEAAKEYWEKMKLSVTWNKLREKFLEVLDLNRQLKGIPDLRKELERELEAISEFKPMEEQANNPITQEHFRKADSKEWGKSRSSRLKLAQDIFTPPRKRRVPKEEGLYENTPHDEIPLECCVFNPSLIPNRFLERFKLTEKFTKDMTPFQKMKRKAEAIPDVKTFFEHLEPLFKGVYRLLVLKDYDPEFDGIIIYSRYLGMLPEPVDRKIMQVFDNVYSARRKTEHEDKGYEAELPKIKSAELRIRAINKQVGAIRAKDPDRELKEEEACKKLAEEIKELQRITNYYKRSAREVLKNIAELKDSLGRKNLAATCAQLLTVLRHIKERPQQIFGKSKYTSKDRNILNLYISEGEPVLQACFRGFKELCQELSNAGLAKRKKRKTKSKQVELLGDQNGYLSRAIFAHLESLPDFSGLPVRPFNLYIRKLQEKCNAIIKAMKASDYETVRDESLKAYVICKIFEVQKVMEKVLRDISLLPLETHVGVLFEKAKKLDKVVKGREVFPNMEVKSYKAVYGELEKKIGDFVRGLEHYKEKDLPPEKRKVMYSRLKEFLEEIDFEAILAELD